MLRAVLTIFCLLYIGIQLTFLEANSHYAWIFLIGDVVLSLTLFIIQWVQVIEENDKEDEKEM